MEVYVISEREEEAEYWEILAVVEKEFIEATIDKHFPLSSRVYDDNIVNEFVEMRCLDMGDYWTEVKIEKFIVNEL